MIKIGLTGGIASGKSLVSTFLKEMAIPVCDTDQLAREVVQVGEAGLKQIVSYFGETILLPNGELDREKLGHIVFNDAIQREQLNQLLHPLIFEKIDKWLLVHQEHPIIVIDMPLLFEVGYNHKVDEIWVVYVDQATQLTRLMNRNHYTIEEANLRMRSQMLLDKKCELADVIINNNNSKMHTQLQVKKRIQTLMNQVKVVSNS